LVTQDLYLLHILFDTISFLEEVNKEIVSEEREYEEEILCQPKTDIFDESLAKGK
jgi:hypothetical protein